jgi:hypothetical protein
MSAKENCITTYEWFKHKVVHSRKKHTSVPEKLGTDTPPPPPPGETIMTLAVVLDGEVQEVIRAQARMTALFLSTPQFIEVPEDTVLRPTIGWTYKDGVFVPPMTEA